VPRLAALVEQPALRLALRSVPTDVLGEDRDEFVCPCVHPWVRDGEVDDHAA